VAYSSGFEPNDAQREKLAKKEDFESNLKQLQEQIAKLKL
jgi:hypothetical protein